MSADEAPELVSSEVVHEGRPFAVRRDTLRYDDEPAFVRSVVVHPGAVALIALDEAGRWLLVRQYRHPVRAALLEVPAGTLEPGEAPEAAAQRELREETGLAAGRLERVGGSWMAPGYCTEYIHYFVATGLRPDPLPPDEDERLSMPVALPLAELEAAARRGEIEDAKTLVAMALMRARAAAAEG